MVSSGYSGFLHQKTDFIIIISPPWYDPGCCWGFNPNKTELTKLSLSLGRLSQFYVEFESLLGNKSEIGDVTRALEDFSTLRNLQTQTSSGNVNCPLKLGNFVVNSTEIQQRIRSQGIGLTAKEVNELLDARLNISDVSNQDAADREWEQGLYIL